MFILVRILAGGLNPCQRICYILNMLRYLIKYRVYAKE